MKSLPVTGVQPDIFRWARETIGLTLDDVAQKLKRPVEEIEAWEDGKRAPTYPQLEKLAYQVYKRPLAVFFLPERPVEISPKKEFRTLPEADLNELYPDTHIHFRKAHAYLLALKDVFSNINPSQHLIWHIIELDTHAGVVGQAKKIRDSLKISIEDQVKWKDDSTALKAWRGVLEAAGIFVFKAPFKQKDISGFCLSDEHLPIIYLNNSTTKTRQIFSLLHELAHLLLKINGLSKFDQSYMERLPENDRKIEHFCNAIAAEVLVPAHDFEKQSVGLPHNVESVSDTEISHLASRYAVSREAILRRFLDQRRVSITFYKAKAKEWASQKKIGKGGDWYASTNAYLSENFAREVVSQHYRHQISMEQAADFLGIKVKNFEGLEQKILQGAGG